MSVGTRTLKYWPVRCVEIVAYCYLNTRMNQYFWMDREIKETINCDHLVRFPKMDFTEEYYE